MCFVGFYYQKLYSKIATSQSQGGNANIRIVLKKVNVNGQQKTFYVRLVGNLEHATTQAGKFAKDIYSLCAARGSFLLYDDYELIAAFRVFSPIWLLKQVKTYKTFDCGKQKFCKTISFVFFVFCEKRI